MSKQVNYRVGKWLPSDQAFLEEWLQKKIVHVEENEQVLLPPVQDFKDLIESSRYYMTLFTAMFNEVPTKPPYDKDPTGKPQIRNYHQMLDLINVIITESPEFNTTGLVGFPINAILDWPMGTMAGYVAFLDAGVNEKLKAILDYWKEFLMSEESGYILNTSSTGWLNDTAISEMCAAAEGTNFTEIFNCPSDNINEQYGFTSWDQFFTREFNPGVRPLAGQGDNTIIANACESAPFRLEVQSVQPQEKFYIKGQPYSLLDMLANDPLAEQFIGGSGATVYQAFLNAISYHRWNSPVSGEIVKAYVVDGTYYSENYFEGFANPDGPDDSAPNDSQAYLTEVATRALIFIQADNPKIGLMCFMSVGMAEVSSNDIQVIEGQRIEKGDPLGMFHFGGSTHCLIFRPGVNLEFNLNGQQPSLTSNNIPVRSEIARVI